MFVALITVIEDWYQSDNVKREEIHIIDAKTQEEAIDKLEHHYEMQNSEYCVAYRIEINSINEIIR